MNLSGSMRLADNDDYISHVYSDGRGKAPPTPKALFSKKRRSRESSKAGEIFHPLEPKTSFSTAEKAQKRKNVKREFISIETLDFMHLSKMSNTKKFTSSPDLNYMFQGYIDNSSICRTSHYIPIWVTARFAFFLFFYGYKAKMGLLLHNLAV